MAEQKKTDVFSSDDKENKALEICVEYRENYAISRELLSDVLLGVKKGEDIYELFLKEAKALSLMLHDDLYYTQIAADIQEIYGAGLGEPAPLKMELEATKERLRRLKDADAREPSDRIKLAITAHERHIRDLEAKLTEE